MNGHIGGPPKPSMGSAGSTAAVTGAERRMATRVLVIEDDATILESFERLLLEDGYIVRAVTTSEAGLAEAAISPPDAVLLDLHLPLSDGLECLRRFRAAPLQLTMPVAILTGDYFLDEDVARELRALGACIHFKPVWDSDLREIVEALVSQRAQQRL